MEKNIHQYFKNDKLIMIPKKQTVKLGIVVKSTALFLSLKVNG